MIYLRGVVGVALLLSIAWAMSSDRRRVPWRVIAFGLGLQALLAWALLGTAWGLAAFDALARFVVKLVGLTAPATAMLFGELGDPQGSGGFAFAFAAGALVSVIFLSALMSVLYHLGVMQVVIWVLGRLMAVTMGVSGAEAMAMAANVFAGQTEAPLVIKPYIPGLTRSELNALMTGGFATVAGSVLGAYLGFLGPEIGGHLLTASVMSAPAALMIAKIMVPEAPGAHRETGGHMPLRIERTAANLIEAAADGTRDGLKLYLNILAMLLAFITLLALIDWPLGVLGEAVFGMARDDPDQQPLSLQFIFGYVLAPLAWAMGVQGWHDIQLVGGLLGTKIVASEFVAFNELGVLLDRCGGPAGAFESPRSAQLAAYALCGFANFASIGIQLGGITPLAPGRKTELAQLALRAMIGGLLASATTAAVAGMFLTLA